MTHKNFAVTLARQAGKIIRANFTLGMKKEWKKDDTPLTVADTKINALVRKAVQHFFPTHGFLGEEGGSFTTQSEYTWVCDPVDGTIPFSHGIPTCAFLLALVKNGVPILGVAFDPFLNRLFIAEKNKGAFMNGKRLHVSKNTTLKNHCIGVLAWKGHFGIDFAKLIALASKEGAMVANVFSTGYMSMLVASGDFIGNIWPAKYPWDVAAIKVIVEEAGGRVTDLNGKNQRYDRDVNGALITNGRVHNALRLLVQKSRIP